MAVNEDSFKEIWGSGGPAGQAREVVFSNRISEGGGNSSKGVTLGGVRGQCGYNGMIGEILLFGEALSDAQAAQVTKYLAFKWGLPFSDTAAPEHRVTADDVDKLRDWDQRRKRDEEAATADLYNQVQAMNAMKSPGAQVMRPQVVQPIGSPVQPIGQSIRQQNMAAGVMPPQTAAQMLELIQRQQQAMGGMAQQQHLQQQQQQQQQPRMDHVPTDEEMAGMQTVDKLKLLRTWREQQQADIMSGGARLRGTVPRQTAGQPAGQPSQVSQSIFLFFFTFVFLYFYLY